MSRVSTTSVTHNDPFQLNEEQPTDNRDRKEQLTHERMDEPSFTGPPHTTQKKGKPSVTPTTTTTI